MQAPEYCFTLHSSSNIEKFEIGRPLFENFGKFEKQSSKFWNIWKIGREQMNEAYDIIVTIYMPSLGYYPALGLYSAGKSNSISPWRTVFLFYKAMFYLQNKGHGKAAKVVNFVTKWLNLCLSTVYLGRSM